MTQTKGTGQGSGGKGLLVTAITAGTAQTLHTAVAGAGTPNLCRFMAVNTGATSAVVTLRFEPSDASAAVEIKETIPAQSAFRILGDTYGVPLNEAMVVKVYADTASAITMWVISNDQATTAQVQQLLTGEITLVQNTDAFRMNGVASSATEADHQVLIPVDGVLSNLRAKALSGIGGGATVTVTVRVNGANTALSFTYAAVDTTTLKSDTDTVAVSAGDLVTINCATDNTGAPADTMQASVDFTPSA